MPHTPPFSILVIARNEAHTLPRLAESLRDCLAAGVELIVIDTGSEDETAQVARGLGARVELAGDRFHSTLTADEAAAIDRRFARGGEAPLVEAGQRLFDYGRARQFASERASHDFVWHIDASDVLLSVDLDFLAHTVRSGRAHSLSYFLEAGPSRFRVARFFDRRRFAWRGRVHELPVGIGGAAAAGTRVECSDAQLSLRHIHGQKTRTYVAGLAVMAMEDPEAPRWMHYLGRELRFAGRYRSAIGALRGACRLSGTWAGMRSRSLDVTGQCWEALDRPAAAAACYSKAARLDLSRRQPLLRLASLLQRRGDFQQSVAFAAAALTLPQANAYVDAAENHPADPHALLYWGLFWLGRREEARTHWEICRRLAPDDECYARDARLFTATEADGPTRPV